MNTLIKKNGILKNVLFLFAVLFAGQTMAQNESTGKANVSLIVKTKINAPADVVWELLGKQFANISSWSESVKTSIALNESDIPETEYRPISTAPVPARQTTVENKGTTKTLVEILTAYSDVDRSLKFYGIGLPKFIAFASDEQNVIVIDDKNSEVVFHLEARLNGIFKLFKGKMKKRFAENLKKIQNDLKSMVEKKREANT